MLDRVGLKPGMSCLDVGAGPGAVMRLMADRVGPQGRVTGIEIDRQLGAQALADLRAQGGAQFDLIEANVLELDTVPGAPFDLTFCRLFLMHMQDPVAALEKMSFWTKPGGVLVAQEFDFGAIAVEPLCPAMAEFNRLFEGVFRGHGRNLRAGRQLPAQFEAAGLGVPDGTLADVKYLPLKDMAAMLIGVYQGLFASAAELGIADPVARRTVQGRHGRCRRGWALLLPHPHPHRRLEARGVTGLSPTRPSYPLLLAGHRVASYITAEPRRMSRRARRMWGPTSRLALQCRVPLMGPGRSARKRGL